jgi:DNA-binding beta-propeller fold protein YncE
VLTPIPGSPFAAGLSPITVTVDPSGQFAYVTNRDSNNISGYTISVSSGALTPIPDSPFPAGVTPIEVITSGITQ